MARDEFDKLLAKRKPTPKDAGRVLLFEMVEFLRKDREGVSRISPQGINDYVLAAMKNDTDTPNDDDPFGGAVFPCYREAYHKMLFWPEVCGLHYTAALWSLERLKNMVKTILLSERQYEYDLRQPVIMTKGQYKRLKIIDLNTRKKRIDLHDIVLDFLDYMIDRNDMKVPLFGSIRQDDVDAKKPKSWKKLTRQSGWLKFVFGGEEVTPFGILSRHRDIYTGHEPGLGRFDIYDDFPDVMRPILSFLKICCHIETADFFLSDDIQKRTFAMEWTKVTIDELLKTDLRRIYKKYLSLPANVAVIQQSNKAPDNGIDRENDLYFPEAPFWTANCFANCKATVRQNAHTFIKKTFKEMELVFRWQTMVQLCAETFQVADLPKILPVLGREQGLVDEYNDTVDQLEDMFRRRLMYGDICRLDYEELIQAFPKITLEQLRPKKDVVDSIRERLTPATFVTEHLNYFEELGTH